MTTQPPDRMVSAATLVARHCGLLTDAYAALLPKGTSYALVDFPNHSNVGDSAIWLGERRLLRVVTGKDPAYVASMDSFDEAALAERLPEGPILIHGGGNLGDVWRPHQDLRERLLAAFPGRLIVQLPQSIHFASEEGTDAFARACADHGDFKLMVRDQPSADFARDRLGLGCDLLPDSAVGMGLQDRPRLAEAGLLMLMRTDQERDLTRADDAGLPEDAIRTDWLEEPAALAHSLRWKARAQALARGRVSAEARRLVTFDALAEHRVRRGLAQLSRGRGVVTDRLHGHILSLLLDLPHAVLDNSYGKVSRYRSVWTRSYERARDAGTEDQAVRIARGLSAPDADGARPPRPVAAETEAFEAGTEEPRIRA